MRTIRTLLAAAIVALTATSASAVVQSPHAVLNLGTLLNGIALNASAGTRTFSFSIPGCGYAKATLTMARTRVAGTNLSMTCTRTDAAGVSAAVTTCAWGVGDGICTHVPAQWLRTSSTTETIPFEVDVLGYCSLTCVVASSSAGSSDLLTVTGDVVTQ